VLYLRVPRLFEDLALARLDGRFPRLIDKLARVQLLILDDWGGAVAELVGIEGGVVSGVINLESSGVEALDWRPRHDERYHEA
jgi:hypothetical protein